jgi:hypothetical protein
MGIVKDIMPVGGTKECESQDGEKEDAGVRVELESAGHGSGLRVRGGWASREYPDFGRDQILTFNERNKTTESTA